MASLLEPAYRPGCDPPELLGQQLVVLPVFVAALLARIIEASYDTDVRTISKSSPAHVRQTLFAKLRIPRGEALQECDIAIHAPGPRAPGCPVTITPGMDPNRKTFFRRGRLPGTIHQLYPEGVIRE